MRFPRSLRFKFVASFVLFVVALSGAMGWLASRQITGALYEQLLRQGELPPEIHFELRQTQIQIGLLALAFVLAGLVLSLTLFQAILGPVGRMMAFVKRFGQGELTARVQVTSGDELEALAQEFNLMADSLAHRDLALRRMNERLEEANRRLQQVNRELEEANQAKGRFLSTMGHELKTPLHSVRGYAQLLLREEDGRLTRSQREDVEAILQAGDHLLELIDNILYFTRIGQDRDPLHLEPVELVELVGRSWDHLRFLAERRRVRLRLLAPRQVRVMADRTRLRQVMINLLHNAVKFTRHGVVQVRLEPGERLTVVEVSDTGRGLEPGQEEAVFDPFVQLSGPEEPGQEGIGLGLAVVRRFVQLHGGRVWARAGSPLPGGSGATFVVELPAAGPSAPEHAEEVDLHAHSGGG